MTKAHKRKIALLQCLLDTVDNLVAHKRPLDLLVHNATNEVHKKGINRGVSEKTQDELMKMLKQPVGEVLLQAGFSGIEDRVLRISWLRARAQARADRRFSPL